MSGNENERLEAEIEASRADLADTVDALSSRVAKHKASAKTGLVCFGVLVGAGVVGLVVLKQVRARRS